MRESFGRSRGNGDLARSRNSLPDPITVIRTGNSCAAPQTRAIAGRRTQCAAGATMAEIEWEIEASRSGVETLKLARRHAHSAYDPLREADRLAEQIVCEARRGGHDALITIGSGLGYVSRAVFEKWSGPILHWEPFPQLREELTARGFPEAFASNLESHPARGNPSRRKRGRSRRRIWSAVTTREFDAALSALGADCRRPYLWVHPGYEHVCRFETRYALRALRRNLAGQPKLHKRAAVVSRRSVEAVSQLPFCPVIDDLVGCLAGQTAIIASAGPSLRAVVPSLAKRPGGARFACVQVLKRFAAASAHVHFAVTTDLRNLFEIFGVPDDVPYDVLLADSSSTPAMLRDHFARCCLFHQRTLQAHQLTWQDCGLNIIDEPTVSVSETSMLLAHRMGARRFILIGVDLDSDAPRYRERFTASNCAGETVPTNSHYFHASRYLNDYCSRLADQGCEIYRLGHGLPIAGCQAIDANQFDALLRVLPAYQTPRLPRRLHPGRLEATRRHYQWLASNATVTPRPPAEADGIGRNDPDWEPLDPAASRRLAKDALRVLHKRCAAYPG